MTVHFEHRILSNFIYPNTFITAMQRGKRIYLCGNNFHSSCSSQSLPCCLGYSCRESAIRHFTIGGKSTAQAESPVDQLNQGDFALQTANSFDNEWEGLLYRGTPFVSVSSRSPTSRTSCLHWQNSQHRSEETYWGVSGQVQCMGMNVLFSQSTSGSCLAVTGYSGSYRWTRSSQAAQDSVVNQRRHTLELVTFEFRSHYIGHFYLLHLIWLFLCAHPAKYRHSPSACLYYFYTSSFFFVPFGFLKTDCILTPSLPSLCSQVIQVVTTSDQLRVPLQLNKNSQGLGYLLRVFSPPPKAFICLVLIW